MLVSRSLSSATKMPSVILIRMTVKKSHYLYLLIITYLLSNMPFYVNTMVSMKI